jgi:hypothetical protein
MIKTINIHLGQPGAAMTATVSAWLCGFDAYRRLADNNVHALAVRCVR